MTALPVRLGPLDREYPGGMFPQTMSQGSAKAVTPEPLLRREDVLCSLVRDLSFWGDFGDCRKSHGQLDRAKNLRCPVRLRSHAKNRSKGKNENNNSHGSHYSFRNNKIQVTAGLSTTSAQFHFFPQSQPYQHNPVTMNRGGEENFYNIGDSKAASDKAGDFFLVNNGRSFGHVHNRHGGSHGSGGSSSVSGSSAAPSPPITCTWQPAIDPVTGRTYYYDTITRKTQWEKPSEIRAMEKRRKKEIRKQNRIFFREMESNIIGSLQRGEVIPGVPKSDTTKQGPPKEPLSAPPVTKNFVRVRTISAMDERMLADINKQQQHDGGGNSNAAPPPTPALSVAVPRAPGAGPPIEGRPPLPRPSGGGGGGGTNSTARNNASGHPPLHPPLPKLNAMDSLELSPDGERRCFGVGGPESDSLRGVHLLDGPLLDDGSGNYPRNNKTVSRQFVQENSGRSTPKVHDNGGDAAAGIGPRSPKEKQSLSSSLGNVSSLSHIRRNTGGTIYLHNTMDNPDINATIKCVCGVYRAHIVQASAHDHLQRQRDNSQGQPEEQLFTNVHKFCDDYRHSDYYSSRRSTGNSNSNKKKTPTINEIESFYQEFFSRSQMEHDTIIMSLIYVERLVKETDGLLKPTAENWRSILLSCMILASKVWDDLSMWNIDFSNVSAASGLSSYTLKRINELEIAVLTSLNFDVRVPASEYAKYYFLIRTMLIRSGMLKDAKVLLRRAEAKDLESRTSHYQDSKLKGKEQRGRRARSVDFSFFAVEADEAEKGHHGETNLLSLAGPVLKDKVCLEQLVTMADR